MKKAEYEALAAEFLYLLGETGDGKRGGTFTAEERPEHAARTEEFLPEVRSELSRMQETLAEQSAMRRRQAAEYVSAAEKQIAAEETGGEVSEYRGFFPEAAALSAETDMNEISEFFRRDSRRYDNGF